MNESQLLELIQRGRTDYIIELMRHANWRDLLFAGQVKPLQWLIYYNDLTGLRMVIDKGGSLGSIDLNKELANAAFFGYWKICDFLIAHGADVNTENDETHETPLHNALTKAGRPYFLYVVKLLLEKGANVQAKTLPGKPTGAFMRDVRTRVKPRSIALLPMLTNQSFGYYWTMVPTNESKTRMALRP